MCSLFKKPKVVSAPVAADAPILRNPYLDGLDAIVRARQGGVSLPDDPQGHGHTDRPRRHDYTVQPDASGNAERRHRKHSLRSRAPVAGDHEQNPLFESLTLPHEDRSSAFQRAVGRPQLRSGEGA